MQSLNNDMDEQFREAGAKYPLKTNSGNFDAVLQQLQSAADAPISQPENKSKRRGLLWWWLLPLLLLIGYSGYRWLLPGKPGTTQANATRQADKTEQARSTNNTGKTVPNSTNENKDRNAAGAAAGNTDDAGHAADATGNTAPAGAATAENSSNGSTAIAQRNNRGDAAIGHNAVSNNRSLNEKNSAGNNRERSDSNQPNADAQALLQGQYDQPYQLKALDASIANTGLPLSFASGNKQISLPEDKKGLHLNSKDTAAPVIKLAAKPWYRKGLYVGMQAAGDVSTVKMQKVKNLGYSAGVLVGYRLSKRWAVEAGALWSHKAYYTSGEYFNTKKIPIQYGTKILTASGWCNMIEIPVNARYYFSLKDKSSWSVAAGLSSYLMTRESYDYQLERGGSQWPSSWDYTGKQATKNVFSIMQLGIGYERKAGVLGVLRVEPYFKLPFNGAGIGNLSLLSTGINVGLTKSIGR